MSSSAPSSSRCSRSSRTAPLWLFAVVCGVALPAAARQPEAPYAEAPVDARYEAAVAHARAEIRAFMEEHLVPGLQVAVGIDGRVVWSEGFGFADIENRVPVTPLTKFRIGSVSKTLTADALALLYQRGALDLDVPVQTYVPNFPRKRWPITTRQVGGHLAGIRHYRGNESVGEGQRPYFNVHTALRIFRDDTLLFEPGTDYSYSSYGWNLLSAVVQEASGMPYLQFMDQEVLERLGLRHTVADHVDSIVPFRTRFYSRGNGAVRNAPFVNNSYKWAGGGYLSTMEDLVRFAFARLDSSYLDRETIELFWTSQYTRDGERTDYGMGWRDRRDEAGRRIVGHSGGSVGGRTQFLYYPAERVVVAVTANLSEAPVSTGLAESIVSGFLPPD